MERISCIERVRFSITQSPGTDTIVAAVLIFAAAAAASYASRQKNKRVEAATCAAHWEAHKQQLFQQTVSIQSHC